MHDQIRRDISHVPIEFLWLKYQRLHRSAFVIGQGFEASFDFILKAFVFASGNHALWLPSLHVEKYSRIISAFAPRASLAPIHSQLFKRSERRRVLFQN